MKKRRVIFRQFPFNRLTLPLLLNIWETHGLDRQFDIHIAAETEDSAATGLVVRRGDVLLYSFMTPHLPQIAEEWSGLRKEGVIGVVGGPHVSGEHETAMALGFHVVAVGSGEDTLVRLAGILDGDGLLPSQQVLFSSGADEWERYLPLSGRLKTSPPLEIMRGCFHGCNYCQTGGQKPLFRSLDSIGRYLEALRRRGCKRVGFISPSALEFATAAPGRLRPDPVESLLRFGKSFGFPFLEYGIFPSEIRPDTVNEEVLRAIRPLLSNKSLTIGAQSGLDGQLIRIGRAHTRADIERAVAMALACGFSVNLDFIFALPDETGDERRENLEFILQLNRRYRAHIQLHHFFPVSGSPFARRFPSYLQPEEKERLASLKKWGIGTAGWLAGENLARNYFAWLGEKFPALLRQYH